MEEEQGKVGGQIASFAYNKTIDKRDIFRLSFGRAHCWLVSTFLCELWKKTNGDLAIVIICKNSLKYGY